MSSSPEPLNPKVLIGAKKAPLRLVPPALGIYVSGVMVVGDEKYTKFNWRLSPLSRVAYLEAIRRHCDAALDGEDTDPETGFPHEASIGAGVAILLDSMEHGNLVDDRDKSGYVPRLLDKVARRVHEIRQEFADKRVRGEIKPREATGPKGTPLPGGGFRYDPPMPISVASIRGELRREKREARRARERNKSLAANKRGLDAAVREFLGRKS